MKLTLGRIFVRDIVFADEMKLESGVLYVDSQQCEQIVLSDDKIATVSFDIAKPGESVRITPVKDVIEPRVKAEGPGGIFPGMIAGVETVGSGKTHALSGMALVTAGLADASAGIPLWVKLTCAATMALGTSIGGGRIMRTVGDGVTKLNPVIGFVAQTSSAIAIETMTAFGAPVSTTQVITTSIMGAGSARRRSSVRWGIARKIIAAWFITLPITIALGGLCAHVIGLILG